MVSSGRSFAWRTESLIRWNTQRNTHRPGFIQFHHSRNRQRRYTTDCSEGLQPDHRYSGVNHNQLNSALRSRGDILFPNFGGDRRDGAVYMGISDRFLTGRAESFSEWNNWWHAIRQRFIQFHDSRYGQRLPPTDHTEGLQPDHRYGALDHNQLNPSAWNGGNVLFTGFDGSQRDGSVHLDIGNGFLTGRAESFSEWNN